MERGVRKKGETGKERKGGRAKHMHNMCCIVKSGLV